MNSIISGQPEKMTSLQGDSFSFIYKAASFLGRLTGFSDLTESVQAFRQKEYRKGTGSLAYGITKLVVIGASIYKIFSLNKEVQQLRESNNKTKSLESENNQKTIDELKGKILELGKNEEDKTQQLKDQEGTIQNHQKTIDELRRKILELGKNEERKIQQLKDQESAIENNQKTINTLNDEINQLNSKNEQCTAETLNQKKILDELLKTQKEDSNLQYEFKKEVEGYSTQASSDMWLTFKKSLGLWTGIPLVDPILDIDSVTIYANEISNLNPRLHSDAEKIICNSAFTNLNCGTHGIEKMCTAIQSRLDRRYQKDLKIGPLLEIIRTSKIKPACNTLASHSTKISNSQTPE